MPTEDHVSKESRERSQQKKRAKNAARREKKHQLKVDQNVQAQAEGNSGQSKASQACGVSGEDEFGLFDALDETVENVGGGQFSALGFRSPRPQQAVIMLALQNL